MNETRIDALLELGARVGYRGGAEAVERLRAAMQKLDANELGAEALGRLWTVRYALMISGAELPPVPEGGESGVAGARVEELRALAALRNGDELAALTSFDRARELGGDDREFLAELELDRCTWLSPLLRAGLGEEFERQLAELERRPVGDATLWRARVALARGRLAVLRGELERASSEPPASEAPGGSYRGALGPVESELDRAARLFTDVAQLSGRGWARWWQLLALDQRSAGEVVGEHAAVALEEARDCGDRLLELELERFEVSRLARHDCAAAYERAEALSELADDLGWAAPRASLDGELAALAQSRGHRGRAEAAEDSLRDFLRARGLHSALNPKLAWLARSLVRRPDRELRQRLSVELRERRALAQGEGLILDAAWLALAEAPVHDEPGLRPELRRDLVEGLERAGYLRAGAQVLATLAPLPPAKLHAEFDRAEASFEALDDPPGLARCDQLRALIRGASANPFAAPSPPEIAERRRRAERARARFLEIGDEAGALLCELVEAFLAFELTPASETCRALREFSPRLEAFGFKRELAEVHEALAAVYMPWSKPRREHEQAALALWRELGHTKTEISQRRSGLRRATKAAIIAAVVIVIYLLLSLVALPLL